jgi:hypothetical protein
MYSWCQSSLFQIAPATKAESHSANIRNDTRPSQINGGLVVSTQFDESGNLSVVFSDEDSNG